MKRFEERAVRKKLGGRGKRVSEREIESQRQTGSMQAGGDGTKDIETGKQTKRAL